jgi:hypothetical protein
MFKYLMTTSPFILRICYLLQGSIVKAKKKYWMDLLWFM